MSHGISATVAAVTRVRPLEAESAARLWRCGTGRW